MYLPLSLFDSGQGGFPRKKVLHHMNVPSTLTNSNNTNTNRKGPCSFVVIVITNVSKSNCK